MLGIISFAAERSAAKDIIPKSLISTILGSIVLLTRAKNSIEHPFSQRYFYCSQV